MPDNAPKWTPGPWTAERANVGDKHPLFVVCNADIAFRPPCDADAHLIAAAPELYAALSFADLLIDTVARNAPNMGPVLADCFAKAHAKASAALLKANPAKQQGASTTPDMETDTPHGFKGGNSG